MGRLAQTRDKYYPESWLCVPQVKHLFEKHGIYHIQPTKTWCRYRNVGVSSSGHMRKRDLEVIIIQINTGN